MKDILFTLIAKPLHKGDVANLKEVESIAEVKGLNVDLYTAMALAQINKALKGDLKALEWVHNNIGQNPTLLLEEERARLETERQRQMVQDLMTEEKERAQEEQGALGAIFEELRANEKSHKEIQTPRIGRKSEPRALSNRKRRTNHNRK